MIIGIAALKGGVGKTTTAVHIAAYLQQKAKTLLIDADRNRSALVWSKEEKLPFEVASQAGATGLIKEFTHVVIDTKAKLENEELEDLAKGSDLIIIPTTPNHLDLDSTLKAVELLSPWKVTFKILLTRVDSRTNSGFTARKYLQELQLPLFKAEIPRLVAFERAPLKGVIIKDYSDPRAKIGWERYKAVGKEILP